MSLDAAKMKELEPHKRYTLTAALIATQSARTLDDLATMSIGRMQKIHVKAKEALDKYREEYQARTDRLISTFRDVIVAYSTEGEIQERFTEIENAIGENPDQLLTECETIITLFFGVFSVLTELYCSRFSSRLNYARQHRISQLRQAFSFRSIIREVARIG